MEHKAPSSMWIALLDSLAGDVVALDRDGLGFGAQIVIKDVSLSSEAGLMR